MHIHAVTSSTTSSEHSSYENIKWKTRQHAYNMKLAAKNDGFSKPSTPTHLKLPPGNISHFHWQKINLIWRLFLGCQNFADISETCALPLSWLGIISTPSHFGNQCEHVSDSKQRNKLQLDTCQGIPTFPTQTQHVYKDPLTITRLMLNVLV